MAVYLGVIGLLVLLIVMYDFLATTLATGHSGPLSLLVIRFYKVSSLFIYHHVFRNRLLLGAIGPLSVVSILLMWFTAGWIGWVLIFFSTSGAVVANNSAGNDADIAERIYFVGFILTTLGMGSYTLLSLSLARSLALTSRSLSLSLTLSLSLLKVTSSRPRTSSG
jgi:hypothetical protein